MAKENKMKPPSPQAALANWSALNIAVRNATEQELDAMLRAERKGKRRVQFILRIYGRYNRVRTERERRELIGA